MKQQTSVPQQIQTLLQCSDMQYAEFMYTTGLEYLERYIPTDRQGIDLLSRSKIFWAWWRNHWHQRDMQFIHELIHQHGVYDYSYLQYRILYKARHNVRVLINSIYPNAAVLADSYAVMINKVNKEIVAQ